MRPNIAVRFGKRACLLSALLLSIGMPARADEVAFDDFEAVAPLMVPFTIDYSRPGNDMPGEFNGWSLMDVSSWIGHAGVQAGRDRAYFGTDPASRNTAMVADPDEADDTGNTNLSNDFNSYITRAYDITGASLSALELSFDFDFITDGGQTGVVDVSFDGGSTWQNLLTLTVADFNDVPVGTNTGATSVPGIFTAANGDFTPAAGATEMLVRFGCINADNNWWFAFDNVGLTDGGSLNIFEDFEQTKDALLPFSDANPSSDSDGTDWSKDFPAGWTLDNSQSGYPTSSPPYTPSDGTDWTQDLASIGWTIINGGPADSPLKRMYYISAEGAYDGGAVVDALSWSYQTDSSAPLAGDIADISSGWGQFRSMFRDNAANSFGLNNSVLVFDPDQSTDNIVEGSAETPPEGENRFNSYAQKVYDVSFFDNDSLTIELEWEIRVEGPQRQVMEVSFNGGSTWTRIFDFNSSDLANPALQAEFGLYLDLDANGNAIIDTNDIVRTFSTGPQLITLSDFFPSGNVPDSNTMQFRIGCLDAGNNWWFAVDNVLVEASAQAFKMGDTNGDGFVNNGDLAGAITALRGGAFLPQMDFDDNGVVNNGDIAGFLNALRGN